MTRGGTSPTGVILNDVKDRNRCGGLRWWAPTHKASALSPFSAASACLAAQRLGLPAGTAARAGEKRDTGGGEELLAADNLDYLLANGDERVF